MSWKISKNGSQTARALVEAERRVRQVQQNGSKALDLSDLGITTLPKALEKSQGLRELYLHGNPGLGIPPDILGPTREDVNNATAEPANPRAIIDFYLGQRKRGAKSLNEVRLLIVGRGRVGKTSLSKALRRVPHNTRERETRGIERHPIPLKVGRCSIKAYLWDFGGQEFLHQTHQFFFSERSIYLIVLNGRQPEPVQEAEYWLRLIRSYGKDSSVVIVLNRIKDHPFTIDEYFLLEKYPELVAIVRTDCNPRYGIENLRRVIGSLAYGMPSVRVKMDPAWVPIRKYLNNMKESYLTYKQYQNICREFGVTGSSEQDNLATIFNYLGIALNFRGDPRLHATSVLKPRWLVDGIYSVLRQLKKWDTQGEMSRNNFADLLRDRKTYPLETHQFLLAMMEKFELCFAIDGKNKKYLVPGLLDEHQPRELKKFMSHEARRIQFLYTDIRPPGLIPRFIVRSHTLSKGQPRWLRGVVLARGDARALVRADIDGRVTDVFALGQKTTDRVWLTEFILSEMRVLNDKLSVKNMVEDENQPGAWAELEILRDAVLRNEETRTERPVDGVPVTMNVKQQLREFESLEAITPGNSPLPLFICYARANERAIKPLIPSLTVLANRGYISPWRDSDLVPGEDWNETIERRLNDARIILFIVSREFLASEYITKKERPLAMALLHAGKAVVIPVLLMKCSWNSEDFARLEILPKNGSPVTKINPRNDAWFLVEEGITKAVDNARSSLSALNKPK